MGGLVQAVFSLTKLRLLAVRASGLRKLTAEIAAFSELRRLDVSRSRDLDVMEDIPWPHMTTLKSLDLSECRHLRVCTLHHDHFLHHRAAYHGRKCTWWGSAHQLTDREQVASRCRAAKCVPDLAR